MLVQRFTQVSRRPPRPPALCLLAILLRLHAARAQSPGPYATTVTAGDVPRADDSAAVSVVDLSAADKQGAGRTVSLAEALIGEPGVQVRSSGGLGQFSGALLRGAESSEVAILIDGVPLNGGGQAPVDLSQIPIDGLSRIEIYRGSPPLSLGSDAVGGAINLITRRGAGPGEAGLRVVAGGGSFGLRKLALVDNFGDPPDAGGRLRGSLSLSYQGATGNFPYYNTGGLVYSLAGQGQVLRQNDGFDEGAADLRLSYTAGGFKLRLAAHGLLKQQGVPGIGQAMTVADVSKPTLTLGRALLSGGIERAAGPWHLALDVHGLLDRSAFRDLTPVSPVFTEDLGGQAGAQFLAGLTPRPGQQWLLLLEGRREDLRSVDLCPPPRSDCATVPPSHSSRQRASAGLSLDLHLLHDRLLFQPAVQGLVAGSHVERQAGEQYTATTPADATSLFASPRLGARVRLLPGLIARASAGRFVRLPTFLELFGDNAFYRENLSLQPESAWSLEAGTRAEGERHGLRLLLEASAFYRLIDNLIETLHNGPTLNAQNVGSARMAGVETELRASLKQIAALHLTYTFLDARDETDVPGHAGNLLPGRPRHSLFLRADAGHGPWRLFYELDYASALYLDPANLQPRPERTLHGLGVSLGPYTAARAVLSVEMRNLLDTRILQVPRSLSTTGQPQLVPLSDYLDYPLPGRALYATLTIQR